MGKILNSRESIYRRRFDPYFFIFLLRTLVELGKILELGNWTTFKQLSIFLARSYYVFNFIYGVEISLIVSKPLFNSSERVKLV